MKRIIENHANMYKDSYIVDKKEEEVLKVSPVKGVEGDCTECTKCKQEL